MDDDSEGRRKSRDAGTRAQDYKEKAGLPANLSQDEVMYELSAELSDHLTKEFIEYE